MGSQEAVEDGEVCVAFLESEGAEGKTESNVVDCIGFGGGGVLSGGDRDFDLLCHDVVKYYHHYGGFIRNSFCLSLK